MYETILSELDKRLHEVIEENNWLVKENDTLYKQNTALQSEVARLTAVALASGIMAAPEDVERYNEEVARAESQEEYNHA